MSDFTLAGFIEHVAKMQAEMVIAEHEGLERAAEIIEAEAKAEIGNYQGQAGQFAPWEELAEATKDERVKLGFAENDPLLRTGDLRDSIEHKVVGKEAHIGSDSDVAVYQELGTPRIPPRSFLGGAAVRKGEEAAEAAAAPVVSALVGEKVVGGRLAIT